MDQVSRCQSSNTLPRTVADKSQADNQLAAQSMAELDPYRAIIAGSSWLPLNGDYNQPSGVINGSYRSLVDVSYGGWKRITVYLFFIVILAMVILNGVVTIWIMAQINFSSVSSTQIQPIFPAFPS